jgi:type III secretion protein U
MGQVLAGAATLLIAVFGACLLGVTVAAVGGHWGQFGILVAPGILTPNLGKLNPMSGIKNLVSLKKVAEVALSLGKVLVLGLVTYMMVRAELPALVTLAGGTPADIYLQFIGLLHALFRALALVCTVIALIDFAVQRHFQTKSLMMSKEDIKREHRNAEGDPMVKGQRRQLAHELADAPAVEQTDGANAVVVNPTHFAVAMRYDADSTPVPLVLAKGKDEVAQAMIRRAHAQGIPVIRHVWLARTLYATGGAGRPVPRASYTAVAHVYAVVQALAEGAMAVPLELESAGVGPDDGA